MAYYHVYTKGLEDRELFRDREDFIMAMNLVAIVGFKTEVRLLAFVLMSNHVHFVMKCSSAKADEFIWMYKNLLSRYLHQRYGDVKFLRRLETSVDYVPDQGDSLKRLIAYVLNNPVKAGMKCVPQGYEWSSARCYFSTIHDMKGAVSLGELSVREKRRILHTKEFLPDHWKINSDNYVLPESYVDIEEVERIFRSSRSFEFFLSVSHSGKKPLGENISFSDEMLQAAMAELLDKKFGASNVNELDDFLKKNMLKELRSRFSASAKQLARVSFMSVADVLRYLE